ncbi:hypothetical protein ACD578_24530 [Microvirga sp. RSM25]|uniref:hypothetical protein n=1 Tax=Microvirga sp. RSM25 TaxID=3273802 RepID=UPI0038513067
MPQDGEITLTIHGLDAFNRDVDGEVFAEKFTAFMKALAAADTAANGKRRHKFLISGLVKNTATASVREQVASAGEVPDSSLFYYKKGLRAIHEDSPAARRLPADFIRPIAKLNRGVGDRFEFGEVKFSGGEVIRIDAFLQKRAEKILAEVERLEKSQETFFKGQAYGAFDGFLKTVDLRGDAKRAFLILSAGNLQIDCSVDHIEVERLRSALDQRAMVYGLAFYDGESGLPAKIEVRDIQLLKDQPDLGRWRGAFAVPTKDEDEDWGTN